MQQRSEQAVVDLLCRRILEVRFAFGILQPRRSWMIWVA